ncbi:hypothetical protein FHR70_000682 [Microvirga lupini]|uniref:Uncharacterized protein n=1 Tax=Microvirga lupini TaxID=420324 RepID=A0A7W4VJA7_9HYPH|nr:hypothetical protein [Microvirga lupini]MBB3017642.1 hypothetical protein [Microvirga lupini]
MSKLLRLLDIIVPRFISEDTAVRRVGKSSMYEPVCSMKDIDPGERFDGIATYVMFNLFGQGLFPRQVGSIRPWVNPHDAQVAS